MNEISVKRKKGLYDYVMALLVVTSLGFYDIKWLFLGAQGLASFVTFFQFLLGRKKIESYWSGYFLWTVAFASYSALSTTWAQEINVTAMMCTLSVIQVSLISVCILIYCRDTDRVQFIINLFILAAVFLSIRFIITVPVSQWGQQKRFSDESIFGGNSPACVMAYAAVFLLWKLLDDKKANKKTKLFRRVVMLAVFLFVSMMMGTKSGLIVFGVGFVILILDSASNPLSVIGKFFVIAGLAVAGYYLIMNVKILYNSIGYRIEAMLLGFVDSGGDASTKMRMLFAEYGIKLFSEHPFKGVGQDGYRYFNPYEFTYSHTNYTEILSNLGLIGFVIYYHMHFRLLRGAYKCRKINILPFSIMVIILIIDLSTVSYSGERNAILMAIIFAFLSCMNKEESLLEVEK